MTFLADFIQRRASSRAGLCECLLVALVTWGLFVGRLLASDWPQFRGPNGSGISEGNDLPAKFDSKENVLWKVKVPSGNSSPVIVGDRLFLTAFENESLLVLCLDAGTGNLLWQKGIDKSRVEPATQPNGPATPSPVTDGKNVYVFFPEVGLISFGVDGGERWRVTLGPFKSVHGVSASPILAEGNLLLSVDQIQDSYLAAFDMEDGSLRWKAERPSGFLGGFSTPVIYTPGRDAAQVIMAGALELTGYSAKTGERLWWVRGLTNAPVSVPVLDHDTLYTCDVVGESPPSFKGMLGADKNKDGQLSGDEMEDPGMARFLTNLDRAYGNHNGAVDANEWNKVFDAAKGNGGLAAVRLGGVKDVTKTSIRWRVTKSLPYVPSILLYQGVLYTVRDGGILTSLNPETGKVFKQGRLKGAIDKYYASPVAADGKVIVASETGKIAVLKAGADWQMLAVNDLGEECYATPAIASKQIYIRTRSSLYCFGRSAAKR